MRDLGNCDYPLQQQKKKRRRRGGREPGAAKQTVIVYLTFCAHSVSPITLRVAGIEIFSIYCTVDVLLKGDGVPYRDQERTREIKGMEGVERRGERERRREGKEEAALEDCTKMKLD